MYLKDFSDIFSIRYMIEESLRLLVLNIALRGSPDSFNIVGPIAREQKRKYVRMLAYLERDYHHLLLPCYLPHLMQLRCLCHYLLSPSHHLRHRRNDLSFGGSHDIYQAGPYDHPHSLLLLPMLPRLGRSLMVTLGSNYIHLRELTGLSLLYSTRGSWGDTARRIRSLRRFEICSGECSRKNVYGIRSYSCHSFGMLGRTGQAFE
ncbi:hypothetical protein M9H77_02065 [Catharanthus roseus]|uniref:Uncharacterized protein n=1 Tax=Catharanthus roseus TaxID=4058 RepID=A0ACC0C7Q9_CATRO|nr:hypothetical protein M9H77_02065 [Catharanthus roseus]